jgi:hypothetical protein
VFARWAALLEEWPSRVDDGAHKAKVAMVVCDIAFLAVATYQAAGAVAELAAIGRPPMPPLPAFATAGGAAAASYSGPAALELAETLRKLIALGALDAGVVAALSRSLGAGAAPSTPIHPNATQMSAGSNGGDPPRGPTASAQPPRAKVAGGGAGGSGRLFWSTWKDCPKVTVAGREYAEIGGRLYTEHAVGRMLPSSMGGRSIAPAFVEEAISTGTTSTQVVGGVMRTVYTSGTVQVVTEQGGRIVVTINPFSGVP